LGVIKGGSLKSASKKTDDAINGKMKILVTLGFGEDLKAFIYLFLKRESVWARQNLTTF